MAMRCRDAVYAAARRPGGGSCCGPANSAHREQTGPVGVVHVVLLVGRDVGVLVRAEHESWIEQRRVSDVCILDIEARTMIAYRPGTER